MGLKQLRGEERRNGASNQGEKRVDDSTGNGAIPCIYGPSSAMFRYCPGMRSLKILIAHLPMVCLRGLCGGGIERRPGDPEEERSCKDIGIQ